MAITNIGQVEDIMLTHQCELLLDTATASIKARHGNFLGKPTTKFSAATKGAVDTRAYLAINNVRFTKTHPRSRINIENERIYLHGAPDIEINLTMRGTLNTAEMFKTFSLRNATTGILPEYPWEFACSKVEGRAADLFITVQGKLEECEVEKPSDDQTLPLNVFGRILVTSEEATING